MNLEGANCVVTVPDRHLRRPDEKAKRARPFTRKESAFDVAGKIESQVEAGSSLTSKSSRQVVAENEPSKIWKRLVA